MFDGFVHIPCHAALLYLLYLNQIVPVAPLSLTSVLNAANNPDLRLA